MANEVMDVVYVGPKSYRQISGTGESREVVIHTYGDAFQVSPQTYQNMKDVLKPAAVFEAEEEAKRALQEAEAEAEDDEDDDEDED